MKLTNFETFIETVQNAFFGCRFIYEEKLRILKPSILTTSDLLKFIDEPATPHEMYLKSLTESFKKNVRSELYRANVGWIARGQRKRQISIYTINGHTYLVPILSDPSVGIDSSGLDKSKLIVICFFKNYGAAIEYFRNHHKIPKSRNPFEYKWNKLNHHYRDILINNFETILKMSCDGAIIIHTNFEEHFKMNTNIFINIINGCFTGYSLNPTQNISDRKNIRSRCFTLSNNVPCHCDSDFLPLRPVRIVRLLVRTLSTYPSKCTPLYASLTSEESEPIQVTDIIAGIMSQKLSDDIIPPKPFSHLFFNDKKLSYKYRKAGVYVKAYYWFRNFG